MRELMLNEESKRALSRMNALLSYGFIAILAILGLLQLIPGMLQLASGNLSSGVNYFGLSIGYFLGVGVLLVLTPLLVKRLNNRSRVVFGDGTYAVFGLFLTKRFTTADIERVVPVMSMKLGPMSTPSHHLFVVGHTRRLMLLVGQMWTSEQMNALVQDMTGRGAQMSAFTHPITPSQLRSVDPRLLPWHQAHPVAAALIGGAIMLVFMIIVAIVVIAVVLQSMN